MVVPSEDGDQDLAFAYDAEGVPLTVRWNSSYYYYITNIQGDVIGITDSTGNPVVTYTYDAWGNPMGTTLGEGHPNAATLATLNPLRYRGYVYDFETGLYYLQSRYYNPKTSRFVNADSLELLGANGEIASYNLYAYCGNNPVSNVDSSGMLFFTAMGAVTGFIAGVVTTVVSNTFLGTDEDVISAGVHGAVGGAIAGAGVDAGLLIVGIFGTALPAVALAGGVVFLSGGIGNAYTTYATSGGTASDGQMRHSFAVGGVTNVLSFGMSWSTTIKSVDGLLISGGLQLEKNFTVGTGMAIANSMVTGLGAVNNVSERLNTSTTNTINRKLWLMEKRMGHG